LQDLFEKYVNDAYRLREDFHGDITSTAKELSRAMENYFQRSEAALPSFMEKFATRSAELEAAAAKRPDQFRGVLGTAGLPNVSDGPLAHTPANADQVKITAAAERAVVAAAERAVAAKLRVGNDETHKTQSGRPIGLVRSEPAA
jgi:hypothetical protein